MATAYGLDLAGYYGGKTALAKATNTGDVISVTVYGKHAFNTKREGWNELDKFIGEERKLIDQLKPLYVDVPLDLQELPRPTNPQHVWQLTKRPVDYAFDGLPPIADKLGAPVARMLNILEGSLDSLGETLFETYPRASLYPMLGYFAKYKSKRAEIVGGRWQGDDLADVLNSLNVEADEGVQVNDDEFDAAICAITGVLGSEMTLSGDSLDAKIRERVFKKCSNCGVSAEVLKGPQGYVLIGTKLEGIRVEIELQSRF
ncbi:hypothetical protein [Lacipirellula sp.]|uniref:hypothetical protein n=1 Tax=Lacipirellula sp. TaxID=2691419 RepID=UPI003D116E32